MSIVQQRNRNDKHGQSYEEKRHVKEMNSVETI